MRILKVKIRKGLRNPSHRICPYYGIVPQFWIVMGCWSEGSINAPNSKKNLQFCPQEPQMMAHWYLEWRRPRPPPLYMNFPCCPDQQSETALKLPAGTKQLAASIEGIEVGGGANLWMWQSVMQWKCNHNSLRNGRTYLLILVLIPPVVGHSTLHIEGPGTKAL